MTEVIEGVAKLTEQMSADQTCEYRPPDRVWSCKLTATPGSLEQNLWDHCGVPKPLSASTIEDVSARCWPSQAHHLIPWQQLRSHEITIWLAKSPPAVPGEVSDDNDYSVDHGLNGKFMPYASRLAEWRSANTERREVLVNRVMEVAGIQLHQGPHSYEEYGVGEAGYKTRVDQYLQRIHAHTIEHYDACNECKARQQGGKVPPRRNLVRYLDGASARLEVDINRGRIYVSRRAAEFAAGGGLMS